jgi:hypothetical protein
MTDFNEQLMRQLTVINFDKKHKMKREVCKNIYKDARELKAQLVQKIDEIK